MKTGLEIIALALISAFLIFILRELGFRGARLVSALSVIGIILFAITLANTLVSDVFEIAEMGGAADVAKDILKIIGVGYVFGICSDICAELGENGIASAVNIAGRVEILALSLSPIKDIIAAGVELLK